MNRKHLSLLALILALVLTCAPLSALAESYSSTALTLKNPAVTIDGKTYSAEVALTIDGGVDMENGMGRLLFSLMGGGLSMLVMIVLRHLPGLSIYGVSIGGAAAHNIGQIGAAMIVLGGTAVLGYLPVLLAVSLLTGTLTGFVAGLLFRAMKNVKLSR